MYKIILADIFNPCVIDLDMHLSVFAIQLFVDVHEDYVGLLLCP